MWPSRVNNKPQLSERRCHQLVILALQTPELRGWYPGDAMGAVSGLREGAGMVLPSLFRQCYRLSE
jgi:hypothetical protein